MRKSYDPFKHLKGILFDLEGLVRDDMLRPMKLFVHSLAQRCFHAIGRFEH